MLGTFPRKQEGCLGPREQGGCEEPFLRNKGDVRDHSNGTRGMLGIPPREQGECSWPFQGKKGNFRDLLINLRSFLIRRITFKPRQTISIFHASPYVSFSKKILFLSKSVEKFVRSAKKLSFLKFLGQYLIVPLLVCFQLNYSFFFHFSYRYKLFFYCSFFSKRHHWCSRKHLC